MNLDNLYNELSRVQSSLLSDGRISIDNGFDGNSVIIYSTQNNDDVWLEVKNTNQMPKPIVATYGAIPIYKYYSDPQNQKTIDKVNAILDGKITEEEAKEYHYPEYVIGRTLYSVAFPEVDDYIHRVGANPDGSYEKRYNLYLSTREIDKDFSLYSRTRIIATDIYYAALNVMSSYLAHPEYVRRYFLLAGCQMMALSHKQGFSVDSYINNIALPVMSMENELMQKINDIANQSTGPSYDSMVPDEQPSEQSQAPTAEEPPVDPESFKDPLGMFSAIPDEAGATPDDMLSQLQNLPDDEGFFDPDDD